MSRRPSQGCRHPPPWEGVNPKIVSEMLGHAGIQITLDTYGDLKRSCRRN